MVDLAERFERYVLEGVHRVRNRGYNPTMFLRLTRQELDFRRAHGERSAQRGRSSRSASSRLTTLPVAVRGRLSTNRTSGTL